jgi:hypothetical protein
MVPKPGPHLGMAVFCEKVLQEKDGVLTIVRVVDRIIVTASGLDVPSEIPPGQVNVTLAVVLKSGDARGRHSLRVRPELPSGEQLPRTEMPVLFEGEDRGINAIFQIALPIKQEGLYWFDVVLDENQCLTRVPLRIVYQPIRTAAT